MTWMPVTLPPRLRHLLLFWLRDGGHASFDLYATFIFRRSERINTVKERIIRNQSICGRCQPLHSPISIYLTMISCPFPVTYIFCSYLCSVFLLLVRELIFLLPYTSTSSIALIIDVMAT